VGCPAGWVKPFCKSRCAACVLHKVSWLILIDETGLYPCGQQPPAGKNERPSFKHPKVRAFGCTKVRFDGPIVEV